MVKKKEKIDPKSMIIDENGTKGRKRIPTDIMRTANLNAGDRVCMFQTTSGAKLIKVEGDMVLLKVEPNGSLRLSPKALNRVGLNVEALSVSPDMSGVLLNEHPDEW